MDWLGFLDDNRIDYVTRGPNTKKGEVSIQCPWCGEDDHSHHLGISIERGVFGCWRDHTHAGRKPDKLIRALLNCSAHQAKLVIAQYSQTNPELFDQPSPPAASPCVEIEPATVPIQASGSSAAYWRYLQRRGFEPVSDAVERYGLRCAMTGRFKGRVMIPVHRQGSLIGWIGRAITNPVSAPRYLMESPEIKKCLFNEESVSCGGDLLCITEGPFDAMKVDFYGAVMGCVATCGFGVNLVIDQLALLRVAVKKFRRSVILFDVGAYTQAMYLNEWLGAEVINLPEGVKDPGEMTKKQVIELLQALQ